MRQHIRLVANSILEVSNGFTGNAMKKEWLQNDLELRELWRTD